MHDCKERDTPPIRRERHHVFQDYEAELHRLRGLGYRVVRLATVPLDVWFLKDDGTCWHVWEDKDRALRSEIVAADRQQHPDRANACDGPIATEG